MSAQAIAIYSYIASSILVVVGVLYASITNPSGAVNTFMIILIDIILVIFPSTPEEYKIRTLLAAMAESYPVFGWGIVSQIFVGIFGMLAIFFSVKLFRFLPFF